MRVSFLHLPKYATRSALVGVFVSALLVGAVWLIEASVPRPGTGDALGGKLSDVKDKQIDLVVDLSKTFINWSLGVIAANTFFLKSVVESKVTLRRRDLLALECGVVSALMSMVFGHVVVTNAITLLEVDQFHAGSVLISRYMELQYWTLVVSMGLTVWMAHHFFWRQHVASRRE